LVANVAAISDVNPPVFPQAQISPWIAREEIGFVF
jgi:hypothetical protein